VIISGDENGYFLISYDDNRIIAHRIKTFDSANCGFRYITEINYGVKI
jgi:C1A family cysteine protease